jgi:hypothetical protein
MKYIKRYESFKAEPSDSVNEEFLGKLIGGIKNLFKKGQERINKTKGGKEIEAIYQKYLKMIHDQLQKTAQIDLNLAAAAKGEADANAAKVKDAITGGAPAKAGEEPAKAGEEPKKESASFSGRKIFEADDANAKLAADTLKKKRAIMDQIVAKMKDQATKEMDAVLKKFGGAAENPQLNAILQAKKDEFDMAYLNAQISYLDAAGDKTMVAEIAKKRDAVAKGMEAKLKDFENLKPVEYKEGDEVIYLLKGKKPEDYKKDKKPEDQKGVVGVHKIVKIDGDNYTLEDEDGKPTIVKTGAELMGKAEGGAQGQGEGEYKDGDTVIYLLKDKKKEEWEALSDEEKAKPTEGKAAEIVGVKPIEKIDGDKVVFLDKDGKPTIEKTKDEIVGKGEAPKAEGQEDLVKKLGDLKAKKPDEIKKVASYVDFISDEKNKDKIAEIEKIIGEGGEEKAQA